MSTNAGTIDNPNIAAIRLARQAIIRQQHTNALEVVTAMGAMQAQDYYGALWSIGLRSGLTERQVITVLEDGQLIRTWPQRGTLHIIAARDAAWMLQLSTERTIRATTSRHRELGLDQAALDDSRTIVSNLLHQQPLMTRPDLLNALDAAGVTTAAGRGYHILGYLSQTGLTYVGPMRGKQQTFGLLMALSPQPASDRQAGIAELTRRYFSSHGPATLHDFAWWSSLTMTEVKAGLAANNGGLQCLDVNGRQYWLARDVRTAIADVTSSAVLLPGFDEYLLGYQDRSAVLQPEDAPKTVPGGNGVFKPTLVLGGQVAGIWRRTIKRQGLLLEVMPFRSLTARQKALVGPAAQAYAAFLELPLKLVIHQT